LITVLILGVAWYRLHATASPSH